ncbi:CaiB/BaiF CoA transferase family protein [Marinobacter sp. SS21]|uniref:CaiB/BaiF CoA transferase family protein n=1 Tax=Marinobacter sp. SS21 TaxID=2979460 RepID=UPI0023313D13|nr:CaiB/BaiF CoA-transferase family protein [Marinobacter sp. SS21]MDC0662958.1 CaiB/BaiF CoA-transferase family protein [Marinobacter sp. SS21]
MAQQALNNLLVVALEQAVAAPYCSSRLADAGARVIKVERPDGDFARHYDQAAGGESAYFVWLNRGKESVRLDIKDQQDLALLLRMIGQADVFIQNLAPGASARAGLDSVLLRAEHPRLITVDITGYGSEGPYREMKGYDLLVQCEAGLAAITGDEAPVRVGVSVCDIACGMYAHAEVLRALIERQQTGRGQGIEVSLFDAIADWMTVPLLQYEHQQQEPARAGLRHPSITPYQAYRCEDGHQVVVSIQNQREWQRFCGLVLARPELTEDARYRDNAARCGNRAELNRIIEAVIGRVSRDELVQRLKQAAIAYGEVKTVGGLGEHPQLRRVSVATPSGPVRLVAPPAAPAASLRPVPALGEHDLALRQEFGRTFTETLP